MATNFDLISSSSSTESDDDGSSLSSSKIDISYRDLDYRALETTLREDFPDKSSQLKVERLLLYNNRCEYIPLSLSSKLLNLKVLDMSNNMIRALPPNLTDLTGLTNLYLRNNLLNDDGFPKDMKRLTNLRDLNLSGNRLTEIPEPILEMSSLRNLFLGGNAISEVTPAIRNLSRLRVFYLGGNSITRLPSEICQLIHLHALILCENRLVSLPDSICQLTKLECLQLHSNRLTTLPNGLLHLRSLTELSLRDNPLINRFVREMEYTASTLLELAARVVKTGHVQYSESELPRTVIQYLASSHCCLNPNCSGVYFDTRVEHVKFVDFCGKYKIPLMQYLCSSRCKPEKPLSPIQNSEEESMKMKRVLLG